MYNNARVVSLIEEHFVPVRVHVRDQADAFRALGERFGSEWTPTTLILDATSTERHRIEGFLPVDDFLAQLEFGLARVAFSAKRFEDAEKGFRRIVAEYPASEAAPESQYWAGVSRYKATNDSAALAATARAFETSYQDTPWAKKASVWRK